MRIEVLLKDVGARGNSVRTRVAQKYSPYMFKD
jgi:hypothetical protein